MTSIVIFSFWLWVVFALTSRDSTAPINLCSSSCLSSPHCPTSTLLSSLSLSLFVTMATLVAGGVHGNGAIASSKSVNSLRKLSHLSSLQCPTQLRSFTIRNRTFKSKPTLHLVIIIIIMKFVKKRNKLSTFWWCFDFGLYSLNWILIMI